jgi:hypothetical protein
VFLYYICMRSLHYAAYPYTKCYQAVPRRNFFSALSLSLNSFSHPVCHFHTSLLVPPFVCISSVVILILSLSWLFCHKHTRCGYEVTGIILLQASHLYTHSLLRGVAFKVLPLSSYRYSPTVLPLLETFLEILL